MDTVLDAIFPPLNDSFLNLKWALLSSLFKIYKWTFVLYDGQDYQFYPISAIAENITKARQKVIKELEWKELQHKISGVVGKTNYQVVLFHVVDVSKGDDLFNLTKSNKPKVSVLQYKNHYNYDILVDIPMDATAKWFIENCKPLVEEINLVGDNIV
jgi:hypothetical protein